MSFEQDDSGVDVIFVDDNHNSPDFAPMRFQQPREARGLGLALAIVRDVVDAHGGVLSIERGASGDEGERRKTRVRMRVPNRLRVEASAGVGAPV